MNYDLDDAIAVESEQRDGCFATVVYVLAYALLVWACCVVVP